MLKILDLPPGESGTWLVATRRHSGAKELEIARHFSGLVSQRAHELNITLIMSIDQVKGGYSLAWKPVPTVCDIRLGGAPGDTVCLWCASHQWWHNFETTSASLSEINELSAAHMKEAYAG